MKKILGMVILSTEECRKMERKLEWYDLTKENYKNACNKLENWQDRYRALESRYNLQITVNVKQMEKIESQKSYITNLSNLLRIAHEAKNNVVKEIKTLQAELNHYKKLAGKQ